MSRAASFEWSADGLAVDFEIPAAGGVYTGSMAWSEENRPKNRGAIEESLIRQREHYGARLPGQGTRLRRVVVGPLTLFLGHMWGPPVWWLPRVWLRERAVGVGWLTHAFDISVKRTRPLPPTHEETA